MKTGRRATLGRKMDIDIFQLPGILWRRKHYIVLAVIGCVAVAAAYVATLKPVYTSVAELLLDPAGLSVNGGDIASPQVSTAQDQSNLDSQIYVVLSRNTMDAVVQKLDLFKDPFFVGKNPPATERDAAVAAAGALKQRLKVERAGQSLVLSISATHSDPAKAAQIANAVAAAYLKQVEDARSDAARRASNAFQVQASELRDRVLKAELAVENFKSENGLVSTGERGLVVDQQLAGINDQLIAARAAEEQQRTIYEQAQKLNVAAVEAGAIPEVLQSVTMGQLRDRYTQLLDRQTQLSATLGSGHPQLRTIRSQVANMQQSISQELERIRQSMKSSYDRAAANTRALSERLDTMAKSSFDSDEAQIKMRQLENEADAVRAVYKTFLSRAEELGQQQTVNTNNSRIITEATPNPKSQTVLKLIVLAAAALFGTALGTALAVVREVAGRLLTRPAPAPAQSDLPLIARIPVAEPRDKSRSTIMFFLPTKVRHAPEITSRRHLGVLKSAENLLETFHDHLPARIAFVGIGEVTNATSVVSEIVQALIDCGQEVVFAPGHLQDRRRSFNRMGGYGRTGHGFDDHGSDDELPLQDILQYERLTIPAKARYGGRPTYSHFIERSDFQNNQLVLINATGSSVQEYVPSILEECDAFVVICEDGNIDKADLRRFEATSRPWRDRALGQIIIEP